MTDVTEIADGLFRISTFVPDLGIQFNQFLVNDDQPFLVHTGYRKMFGATRDAVASVVDPAGLRWIGFSHFESDECGALNEWLAVAPGAQAVCSNVGAIVSVNDFAAHPARPLVDGELLPLGRHRLRFIATPHLPHGWDAGLFFEETGQTLLCSDLFFHPGDPPPVTTGDIIGAAREAMIQGQAGPLAHDVPYTPYTDAMIKGLADLRPRTLAVMHGSSYTGDAAAALTGLANAIRETYGHP